MTEVIDITSAVAERTEQAATAVTARLDRIETIDGRRAMHYVVVIDAVEIRIQSNRGQLTAEQLANLAAEVLEAAGDEADGYLASPAANEETEQ